MWITFLLCRLATCRKVCRSFSFSAVWLSATRCGSYSSSAVWLPAARCVDHIPPLPFGYLPQDVWIFFLLCRLVTCRKVCGSFSSSAVWLPAARCVDHFPSLPFGYLPQGVWIIFLLCRLVTCRKVCGSFSFSAVWLPLPFKTQKHLVKDLFLMLAHLFGRICLKHSATLILPPPLKPPSRRTCLIIISQLFFTALPIPFVDA